MKGVVFRNADGSQEVTIPVIDKFPGLDLDVDGKWVVEVSLPLFIQLAAHEGLTPVMKEVVDAED